MRRWPLSEEPLPFGKMVLQQADYKEFICSRATFEWLSTGGMTHLDEVPVQLQIMDTIRGGHNVIVKIFTVYAGEAETWVQPADRVLGNVS